jgi:ABC-type phosphate transport system substrate-binding protein
MMAKDLSYRLTPDKDVAIVANPGVPENELSMAQVRNIFMGDRQFWTAKLRIRLILRAPGAWEHDTVLKTVYRMSEAQFRQYWIRKVFRDEITILPKQASSNQTAMEMVARTPGAISFLDATQVPAGLKILKVLKSKIAGGNLSPGKTASRPK